MARLKEYYKETVMPQLSKQFGYKSVMEVPRITKITPAGGMRAVGPLTSTTSAPRSRAADAMAYPIFPDDRFEINRIGSIDS